MLCSILDRERPRRKGSYEELIKFVNDRPGHDQRYAIDSSRIRAELGWRPSCSLELGLEKTVGWYLQNEDWWRPLLGRNGVGKRLGIIA
jgi:dTDP-glucose 4,6-dehydratase